MQLEITEARLAFSYRCAVTDSNGNTVYSEPARMQVATDTWTYTYNADGLRTSRTDGYTTYEYIYHGSQLTQMTVGDDTLRFGYDANGMPLYVIWNQSKYFYVTNLQGDVVAIVSESGYAVVCYTYDAWGNILSITGIRADNLGILNPLRYRGYVYDQETELYYLQSRYYNPEWGRFINADAFVSTGQGIPGNNMFAYCGNNPVCYIDPSGYVSDSITGVPSKFGLLTDYGKGCSGGGATPLPNLFDFIDEATAGVALAVSLVYQQYTKSVKAFTSGLQPGNYPVTHHIIPYGKFTRRASTVQEQLSKAQDIMIKAGVFPESSLYNQVVISAAYHQSLHTNAYILMVTSPIIALGENATKEQVYAVLDNLRIVIASCDPYAYGY